MTTCPHCVQRERQRLAAQAAMEKLSPRQKEAIVGLALGETGKETGARLHLSSKTAWYHLWRACEKCGISVHQKATLIKLAWRAGLVSSICVVCLGASLDPRSAPHLSPVGHHGTNVYEFIVSAQNFCCLSEPSALVTWTGHAQQMVTLAWGESKGPSITNYLLRWWDKARGWTNNANTGTNLTLTVSLAAPPKTNWFCWFTNIYFRNPYIDGFWVTNAGPKDFPVTNGTGKEFFQGIPGHPATNSKVIYF